LSADLDFAYLTTTGRRSGTPHRIEIWYALSGRTVLMLSGGREESDWVRNIMASPDVTLQIGDITRETKARVLEAGTDQDALARLLLVKKYASRDPDDLTDWGRESLAVAVDWDKGG
jgi:deazaflavin-dependent oxidoreductase (nitroreductase family)